MNNLLNKIHFADCLDVLRQLPDGSVDLFLQDPPYGLTNCKWDILPDFAPLWNEWKRVSKPNAAFIFTATQSFAYQLYNTNPKLFRYQIIWKKVTSTGFLDSQKKPLKAHEVILVFYQKLPTYNPVMSKAGKIRSGKQNSANSTSLYSKHDRPKNGWIETGLRYPTDVIEFDVDGERYNSTASKDLHPTKKPTDLFRYLICTYSNPGDVVFDGYGGSGTTAIAAQMEGRRFIVCENHYPYFEASQARLQNLVSQPYLFSDCG